MKFNLYILFRIIQISLIKLCTLIGLFSQGHSSTWIVGYGQNPSTVPKFGKSELSFSSGFAEVIYNTKQRDAKTDLINTSIADERGNILFFTEGLNIYGSDQNIIENGDGINPGKIRNDYNPHYYPTATNHVFLTSPGKKNEYYLIHMSLDYINDSIRSFEANKLLITKILVDSIMRTGKVIMKNDLLLEGHFFNHHLAYCKHANGRDWWIIMEEYNSNRHFIFLLDPQGIKLQNVQDIGTFGGLYDWSGNSIFSPNGSKFIKYAFDYFIQIFDFDRCKGVLSNPIKLNHSEILQYKESSIAISPNSKFLYVSNYNRVWQFDLTSNDISNSIDTVGYWDGFLFDSIFATAFYQMALADDGKIYLSCYSGNIFLHLINNPNEKGMNCNFLLRSVELPAWMIGGLPIMPNFRLGPVVSSNCDTLTSTLNFNSDKLFYIQSNPTSNQLRIENHNLRIYSSLEIEIIDVSGKVIYNQNIVNYQEKFDLDISYITPGLYFVKFILDNRLAQISKLIIN